MFAYRDALVFAFRCRRELRSTWRSSASTGALAYNPHMLDLEFWPGCCAPSFAVALLSQSVFLEYAQ